ncbi:MAG: oligosaccharide flippase family protein [Coriobacteriia bacterium]
MSEKRRLISNTLANGMAQFTAMASSLLFMPLLIRSFGLSEYGLYLLASSIAAYASLVDFGVGTSLVKNVAERSARGDAKGLGKYISTALVFYIGAGLLVAALLGTVAVFAGAIFKVTPEQAHLLRNLLLVVAAASILTWPTTTGGLVLAGLQRFTISATTAILAAAANLGVMLAVLLLHQGPFTLIVGQSIVAIAAGATNTQLARRALKGVRFHPSEADYAIFKDILSFSWVIFVLQLCTVVIYQQTDRIVLGVFLGAAAVTLYESAGKMQGFVMQLTQFAGSAVMPFATQLGAEGRSSSLHTLFFRGTKYVMALVLPVVVGLMILAKPIILHWLGPTFAAQSLAAQVLLSYQLLHVGPVIGESILISRGHARRRLFNSIFVVTLGNLVLSIVLVQKIGIMGVVIGTAVPWIIDFPARMHVCLTEVGVSFWDWLKRSAGPVYLSLIATVAVAFACYLTPLVNSMLGLAGALALSVGAAWVALIALALTPVEKDELRTLVGRVSDRLRRNH